MRAAVVERFDAKPKYGEFREPVADDDEVVVQVRAAALSNLVRGQANGSHYSSADVLPLVPGNDGVGVLEDGTRVYFVGAGAPFGSMAEHTVVRKKLTISLAQELDDVPAAAMGNPGLASWGALIGRAKLQDGETVLVNGATGAAGQQAVQVAKYLGAKRVIATGRDEEKLAALKGLGADEMISLRQTDEELVKAFQTAYRENGVNVVLDYLWGSSAACAIKAAGGHGSHEGEPRIRFVQIGAISGDSIGIEAHVLRSSGLELMGSGLGSLSAKAILESLRIMYDAAAKTKFVIETQAVPLSEVETAWDADFGGKRVVFTV